MSNRPPDSIKEHFEYDPTTGVFSYRSSGRTTKPSHSGGYHRVQYLGVRYFVHRLAYWWHSGEWPEHVDHINRDPSDNRLINLRGCTEQQNHCNRTPWGSSSFRGVFWHKQNKKWVASGRVKGKYYYLGGFTSEVEAGLAYNYFALANHGVYSNLNKVFEDVPQGVIDVEA